MSIAKIIFHISLDFDEKTHAIPFEKMNKMFEKNPHFEHIFLQNEDEVVDFIEEYYDPFVLDIYEKITENKSKVDFAKYLLLYKYGGIYLDLAKYTVNDLDELVENYAVITASSKPGLYEDDILIFPKEHPIVLQAIELIIKYVSGNTYNMEVEQTTGRRLFSKAVRISHFIEYNENIKMTDPTKIYTFRHKKLTYKIYGTEFNNFFTSLNI